MEMDQHQANSKKINRRKPNSAKGKQPREHSIKKITITPPTKTQKKINPSDSQSWTIKDLKIKES